MDFGSYTVSRIHWGSHQCNLGTCLPTAGKVPNPTRTDYQGGLQSCCFSQDLAFPSWLYGGLHIHYAFAHLRLHCLQLWLQSAYSPMHHTMAFLLTVPPEVLSSLQWWKDPGQVFTGIPFLLSFPSMTITTDALLIRWGVHMGEHLTQGLGPLGNPGCTSPSWNFGWCGEHVVHISHPFTPITFSSCQTTPPPFTTSRNKGSQGHHNFLWKLFIFGVVALLTRTCCWQNIFPGLRT